MPFRGVDAVHNCHIYRISMFMERIGKGTPLQRAPKRSKSTNLTCSPLFAQLTWCIQRQAIRMDHVLMCPNWLFAWLYTNQKCDPEKCDLVLLTHRGVYREIYRVREALVRLFLGPLCGSRDCPPEFSMILISSHQYQDCIDLLHPCAMEGQSIHSDQV